MITFEAFAKSLGEHAKHLTQEQLEQLHVDVRKLAKLLVAIQDRRRNAAKDSRRSPQGRLDGHRLDRTMVQTRTRSDDKHRELSQAELS